jgi:cathepsin X
MIICSKILLLLLVAAAVSVSATPPPSSVYSELLDESDVKGDYNKPLPISYIDPGDLPAAFSWGNHQNRSFLTRMLNQHIPQYCGSCWAHAAISVFQDRIKIARHAQGEDIGLSIQYLLNCGRSTGSCHGGTILKTFKFIREESGFIPYETCQPYLACSHDSEEGFCPHVDTTCTKLNTCRTCDTFVEDGGTCREIDIMPNATVAEYGVYNRNDYKSQDLFVQAVKAEILARGPVGVALNGHGLANYTGGVYDDTSQPTHHTHAVSITGWGTNQETGQEYWIVRNSW